MGEYADAAIREFILKKHGFDIDAITTAPVLPKIPAEAPFEKVPCPKCSKRVKSCGLKQHIRDVHQGESE